MSPVVAWICGFWTLGGIALLLQESGAQTWWDVVWVLLLALSAYIGLVQVSGLSRARTCAGIVLVIFTGMVVLTVLSGWPLGPVRFTGPEMLRVANMIPLLPPVFAFALLTLCQRASAVAFPGLETNTLALTVASFFSATLFNGTIFLASSRLWWLWNPWGDGMALPAAAIGFISMGMAGFFLARIYPEDNDLKLTRWSPSAAILVALNILFLAANFAHFARRL